MVKKVNHHHHLTHVNLSVALVSQRNYSYSRQMHRSSRMWTVYWAILNSVIWTWYGKGYQDIVKGMGERGVTVFNDVLWKFSLYCSQILPNFIMHTPKYTHTWEWQLPAHTNTGLCSIRRIYQTLGEAYGKSCLSAGWTFDPSLRAVIWVSGLWSCLLSRKQRACHSCVLCDSLHKSFASFFINKNETLDHNWKEMFSLNWCM